MILWGMGISQHVHGTDNARCLIALTMLTGQVGRPGTGLHPLRGQNNVQGASRRRPDPDGVSRTTSASTTRGAHDKFEALWGDARSIPSRGSPWSRSWTRSTRARSAACTSWARTRRCRIPTCSMRAQALAELEMLVVQDIFLTETAYLADVILPASAFPEKTGTFTNTDRTVQLGRQALDAARRGAPGPRDHHRHRAPARPRLDLRRIRATCSPRCARRCRRSPASRGSGSSASSAVTYPCEQRRRSGRARRVHRTLPDRDRTRAARAGRAHSRRRAARRASIRSC